MSITANRSAGTSEGNGGKAPTVTSYSVRPGGSQSSRTTPGTRAGQRHRVDLQDELPLAPGQTHVRGSGRPRTRGRSGRLDLGIGRQLLGGQRIALRGLPHLDRERDLAAFLQGSEEIHDPAEPDVVGDAGMRRARPRAAGAFGTALAESSQRRKIVETGQPLSTKKSTPSGVTGLRRRRRSRGCGRG